MQTISGVSVSNSHGVYFPELYSPFPDMVMEDGLQCECPIFLQRAITTDTIYVQVVSENGVPRMDVGTLSFNPVGGSGDIYNFAIPMAPFDGQTISLILVVVGQLTTESTPIRVSQSLDKCYAHITWRSECIAQGIDYTIDPNFIQQLHIPIRYIRPGGQETSTYNAIKNSSGLWEFCNSDLDESWVLAYKEVPDWIFQVLSKAILNSTFAINGTEFFSQSQFRKTERRCCMFQGEANVTPRLQDNIITECCINDFTGFVQPPQAQLSCQDGGTEAQVDTRGSSDSDNIVITAASTNVTYIYQFGTFYYATIPSNADPTLVGSWTYIGGSETAASFNTNFVPNVILPVGGFSGFFEIDCNLFTFLNISNLSVSVTVQDTNTGASSSNAVCTISCP